MLVLTRKLGEEIRIGNGITIRVVRTSKNRACLGITARPEVPVWRGELLEEKRKVRAAKSPHAAGRGQLVGGGK